MQSIVHLYKHHENERESQKRLLCDPDLIHNYFLLLKRMFDFFNNRNKCHKPGFLRGNIYTSCISMVLLDHFANKSNTFQHTLSLPLSLSPSLALPFPPISSLGLHFLRSRIPGSRINGTLVLHATFANKGFALYLTLMNSILQFIGVYFWNVVIFLFVTQGI